MYKVISLNNTQTNEKDFNLQYHQKYLNMIGKEVYHKHNSEAFKDFKCIQFAIGDVDWFYRNDLKEM